MRFKFDGAEYETGPDQALAERAERCRVAKDQIRTLLSTPVQTSPKAASVCSTFKPLLTELDPESRDCKFCGLPLVNLILDRDPDFDFGPPVRPPTAWGSPDHPDD